MNLSATQIENRFKKLLKQHRDFEGFWTKLKALGPVAIVGGAVRDWVLDREPKDLDLMVDCSDNELRILIEQFQNEVSPAGSDPRGVRPIASDQAFKQETNYFGSAKLHFLELTVDVLALKETWAFQAHTKRWKPSFESWLETPFFNIDPILYLVQDKKILVGPSFEAAFKDQILDLHYEPNPSPILCVLKSLLHKQKYGLNFSDNLSQYLAQKIYSREVSLRDLSELYLKLYKTRMPGTLLDSLPHPRLRKFLDGLLPSF